MAIEQKGSKEQPSVIPGAPAKTSSPTNEQTQLTAEQAAAEAAKNGAEADDSQVAKIFSQADLDRARTQASETARINERKRLQEEKAKEDTAREEARMKEHGEWESLAKQKEEEANTARAELESERLSVATANYLAAEGLSDLLPLFQADMKTLDGRKAAALSVKEIIKNIADAQVSARLVTPASPKGLGSTSDVDLNTQLKDANKRQDWAAVERINGQILKARRAAGMTIQSPH